MTANMPDVASGDAGRLREAAELLRTRAEAAGGPMAFPAPWGLRVTEIQMGYDVYEQHDVDCDNGDGDVVDNVDPDVAKYILMMHPPVAQALADWLTDYAASFQADPDFIHPEPLALADAILGDRS